MNILLRDGLGKRNIVRTGLTLCLSVLGAIVCSTSSFATDYSHAFDIDNDLCYQLTNYTGRTLTKKCFASSWTELFAEDGSSRRSYFNSEKASFQRATTNGKGAWVVLNANKDNGDSTSSPYFIDLYWVEDNSNGATRFKFASDGSSIYLDTGGNTVHSATIASSAMVQGSGGVAINPSYLWGEPSASGLSISSGSSKLFRSTFPVDYPPDYNGSTVPSVAPAVPYTPAIDYGHPFVVDEGLCYSITNYYGKSLPLHCYGDDWLSLFKEDGPYVRNYFGAEKASLYTALTNGKGAWAVFNSNRDNGDNATNPYFIELYWVEDNSNGKSKIKVGYDGAGAGLDPGENYMHHAVIASSRIVQGGWSNEPSYLWGDLVSTGVGFNNTGDLRLYRTNFPVEYPVNATGKKMAAPGVVPASQLDYLALGDSYSSGEGDTAKDPATSKKYYREHTDVESFGGVEIPREKCHQSARSYPFYMAKRMGLGLAMTQWGDVTCSGAVTTDIYSGDYGFLYNGQAQGGTLFSIGNETPRLEGVSNKDALQAQALNEFIPGRIQQIEFVKKYHPKVITLTMGGNDIDFAGKLQKCVRLGTCSWATEGKARLGREIQNEYAKLVELYDKLYEASGYQAKIYVIGYPPFISGDASVQCGGNILSLDYSERVMIAQSVYYLNTVIEHAANTAGVKYVDVTNALEGGRLCDEGQKYVTGVAAVGDNELQESFHPNDYGHIKIAQKINNYLGGKTLANYNICGDESPEVINCPKSDVSASRPDIPSYFGVSTTDSNAITMTDSVTQQSSQADITLPSTSLRPSSTANITLHSDPIDLGDYIVAVNGSLSSSVVIPSTVPVGYHTLVVSGQTYTGDPVEYEQTILVTSTDPDDLDSNGTPDTQQACGAFVLASGQDIDMDSIDDACDPQISDTPQLYRVREGDILRIYNGSPEHENYLYIERNTHASSITGVTTDDDPDGDGWAIVGVSQGIPYTSTSAPDTAPAANFEVVGTGASAKPYVYIRAGGWGCTSFTPASLAVVQSGQARTIKKVEYNTNKCRQEPIDDDVDGDGQPDNTQALYVARNGDVNLNEDPNRIYLYRNFYPAEAQLGISDYTPTGTPAGDSSKPIQPWNLLSASKATEYIPAFNKLVITQDINGTPMPIILTKKLNGQCVAYRPSSTSIIKLNQQNSLTKLTSVPGGMGCE